MGRQTGDEDVRTNRSKSGDTAPHSIGPRTRIHRATAVEQAAELEQRAAAGPALSDLLMRDDGWLRAIPDGEGKTAYLKWKFTRGQFAGSYVMVVVQPWNWPDGFRMLETKILNCYAGIRKPTKDRDYLPIFDDDAMAQ